MGGPATKSLVVVDDEKYICEIIDEALSSEKYRVTTFTNPNEASSYIENNPVDLVLTDLVMAECSGIDVMNMTLKTHQDAVVILMTAHPTVETAIAVLKKGGYDFLIKPFKLESLKVTIKRALEHQKVLRDNLSLKGQVEFLKLSQAGIAGTDMERYLTMVVGCCMKEFSASAVALLEVDPASSEVSRSVYEGSDRRHLKEVLDETTILQFKYTKSSRPVIFSEQEKNDDIISNRILISQPIFFRRRLHGVINILTIRRFGEVQAGELNLLSILTSSAGSVIANQRLYQDLEYSYMHAIRSLANAVEARDEYTAGHTDRVCTLAWLVALHMGWDETEIDNLIMGCTLHDIGKLGVPDSILNKPGKLTEKERDKMRAHTLVGVKIISGIDRFKPAIPYIIAHHEWYDGGGYPNGLKGEEIPIEGRLLAVVDTFDAIVSDRPYRKAAGAQVAVDELIKFKGIQFDPQIVDSFLEALQLGKINLKELYGLHDSEASLLQLGKASETAPV